MKLYQEKKSLLQKYAESSDSHAVPLSGLLWCHDSFQQKATNWNENTRSTKGNMSSMKKTTQKTEADSLKKQKKQADVRIINVLLEVSFKHRR